MQSAGDGVTADDQTKTAHFRTARCNMQFNVIIAYKFVNYILKSGRSKYKIALRFVYKLSLKCKLYHGLEYVIYDPLVYPRAITTQRKKEEEECHV